MWAGSQETINKWTEAMSRQIRQVIDYINGNEVND